LETLSGIPSVPTLYYGGSTGADLDGEGRYTEVTSSSTPNPVTGVTYSTSSSTNYLGALTGVTYGSSDSDSFTYDPNTGRETGYSFSVNSHADAGTLTWNSNGTLASLGISDAITGTSDTQSCSYTYDDLMRAAGVNCGTAWAQTFGYDAFGNISKTGSLSFQPTYSSATNQFTLSGITVQYDANGNLLTDNLNTYTWDKNWGTMNSVNSITAIYDALGEVVEQQNGSTNTEILYSPIGKVALMNGATTLVKSFMPLPGGGTAIYRSSGTPSYRHADWLGSSRLTSTGSRTVASGLAYAPFGEQYAVSGTADPSFTGQNSDTVPSLYDFMARRLSSSQGRWISPDPAGLAAVDLTSPQSFNRYANVMNNPLINVDPLGFSCGHAAEGSGSCGGGGDGPGGPDGPDCDGDDYAPCIDPVDPSDCDNPLANCFPMPGSGTPGAGGGGGGSPGSAPSKPKACSAYSATGTATYYNLPGKTASGAPFNPNGMNAAMFQPGVVQMGNVMNVSLVNSPFTSVTVTVNDTGPFLRGPNGRAVYPLQSDPAHLIDLTPAAFTALTGSTNAGHVPVTVTRVCP
jgi:RHS repeat-associated protein